MIDLLKLMRDGESDDAALRVFVREFAQRVRMPIDAHVLGEPVELLAIRYEGQPRRGVEAVCRAAEGDQVLSIADVRFARGSDADQCVQAYRAWLGLATDEPSPLPPKTPKADVTDAVPGQNIDLVALAIREGAVRCRILGTARELTLRSSDYWRVVPGEIATVRVNKSWSHARHPYVSGNIERTRLDAPALGLVPLRLSPEGVMSTIRSQVSGGSCR